MLEPRGKSKEKIVSIVIPFFNIPDCVQYCLNSILMQTYQQLEILCIDDGSTDETAHRLDVFAMKDARIRVFHKKNGGLSEARNFGISKATGEYLTFIDGDDIVSPLYVEGLMRALVAGDDALVVGKSKTISYDAAVLGKVEWEKDITYSVVTKKDLFEAFMYEDILPSAWGRLALREKYNENWFPENRIYEEIATIGKLVDSTTRHVVVNEPIYGYVMRKDSIVHKRVVPASQLKDYIWSMREFDRVAFRYVPEHSSAARFFRSLHHTRILRLAGRAEGAESTFLERVKAASMRAMKDDLPILLKDRRISFPNKVRLLVASHIPQYYEKIFRLYEALRCK